MVTTADYAGDVSSAEAWEILRLEPKAQLIDVRTVAEWTFVGVPDLSRTGRELHCVEWQSYPEMSVNPDFASTVAEKVRSAGADQGTTLLFLCRSGGRSRAAAIAMTRAGFTKALNVAGGFEGDLDAARQRGKQNGWKAEGLPWRQS